MARKPVKEVKPYKISVEIDADDLRDPGSHIRTAMGGVRSLVITGHPTVARLDLTVDYGKSVHYVGGRLGVPILSVHVQGGGDVQSSMDRRLESNKAALIDALAQKNVRVEDNGKILDLEPEQLPQLLEVMNITPDTMRHIQHIQDQNVALYTARNGELANIPFVERISDSNQMARYHDSTINRSRGRG